MKTQSTFPSSPAKRRCRGHRGTAALEGDISGDPYSLGATRERADAFNELQRLSASADCAVRYLDTVAEFDVRHLLPNVRTPTLVMHVRDDLRVPIALGRELAAGIPNARFVALPGKKARHPCARPPVPHNF